MKAALTLCLLSVIMTFGHAQEQTEFTMTENGKTYTMKRYFLCMLKAGPNREQDEKEAMRIQEEHLAHINRLAEAGKVAMAGPMGDDGELKGILIFTNVKDKEEVEELAAEDPAVKAGRLVIEVHPWWTAKGGTLP